MQRAAASEEDIPMLQRVLEAFRVPAPSPAPAGSTGAYVDEMPVSASALSSYHSLGCISAGGYWP
jgi:hypothetical protein